jgi:hypothetical protein
MRAQAYADEEETGAQGESEQLDLLHSVASLRDEIRSMAAGLRTVLDDQARLHAEIAHLRAPLRPHAHHDGPTARRSDSPRTPEAAEPTTREGDRFRHQLQEQLERLRRVAAMNGSRPTPSAPRRGPSSPESCRPADAAWLKRMMMVMMMTELV